MNWLSCKEYLPNPKSQDMYWVTDGECVCWCYYGCVDEGIEHHSWIGGDLQFIDEEITHWMKIVLPNSKKEKRKNKIKLNSRLYI